LPRERVGKNLTTQLRRLKKPVKVMLITAEDERPPRQRYGGMCLTVYKRGEIGGMGEKEFTAIADRHDCILLSPQLGNGDLFLKSLREALNNHLGGAGARLILREIEETTPDPHINQTQLWGNLAKTLGRGSHQLKEATLLRLRTAINGEVS